MTETENGLPLGILRQACMKLESFATDIREVMEDEGITPEDKANFETMVEISGRMLATIVNMVGREIDEEEFLSETPDMDMIDEWPGTIFDEPSIEDTNIEESE